MEFWPSYRAFKSPTRNSEIKILKSKSANQKILIGIFKLKFLNQNSRKKWKFLKQNSKSEILKSKSLNQSFK